MGRIAMSRNKYSTDFRREIDWKDGFEFLRNRYPIKDDAMVIFCFRVCLGRGVDGFVDGVVGV